MGSISITNDPVNIRIKDDSKLTLKNDSALTIKDDSKLTLQRVKDIDPIATHIKEVNNIDPFSIESFHVDEIRNIEPIQIAKFNVTNLPPVNVSLRQLPQVDMNVRTLPPISVGTHQDFCIPSSYTLRAQLLGFELLRLHLNGQTSVIPKERARREQARTADKSFPVTSVAGNPAIPSIREETGDTTESSPHALHHASVAHTPQKHLQHLPQGESAVHGAAPAAPGALSFGLPRMSFSIADAGAGEAESDSQISSGE